MLTFWKLSLKYLDCAWCFHDSAACVCKLWPGSVIKRRGAFCQCAWICESSEFGVEGDSWFVILCKPRFHLAICKLEGSCILLRRHDGTVCRIVRDWNPTIERLCFYIHLKICMIRIAGLKVFKKKHLWCFMIWNWSYVPVSVKWRSLTIFQSIIWSLVVWNENIKFPIHYYNIIKLNS
jgi:hypothetical protein